MEKPSSSAKFKGFAEFKTERSVLQTGIRKKKKQNERWKAYVIKLLSEAFRMHELHSTSFLNRAHVFLFLDLASSYASCSSEASKH